MKFKYCTSYFASQDKLKKDSDKKSDSRKKKKSEKKDKKQKKKDKKETGKRKTKVEKKRRREERDQDADEDEDEDEDTDDDKGSDDQGGDDKGGDDKGGETPSSTETIFGDKGDDKGGHDKGDVDYEVGYDEEMRLAWRIPVRGPLSRRCATRDYASSLLNGQMGCSPTSHNSRCRSSSSRPRPRARLGHDRASCQGSSAKTALVATCASGLGLTRTPSWSASCATRCSSSRSTRRTSATRPQPSRG